MHAPGKQPDEPHVPVPEIVKRKCSRPPKEDKTAPVDVLGEVELQKHGTPEDDLHLKDVEDVDALLAEKHLTGSVRRMQTLSSSVQKN